MSLPTSESEFDVSGFAYPLTPTQNLHNRLRAPLASSSSADAEGEGDEPFMYHLPVTTTIATRQVQVHPLPLLNAATNSNHQNQNQNQKPKPWPRRRSFRRDSSESSSHTGRGTLSSPTSSHAYPSIDSSQRPIRTRPIHKVAGFVPLHQHPSSSSGSGALASTSDQNGIESCTAQTCPDFPGPRGRRSLPSADSSSSRSTLPSPRRSLMHFSSSPWILPGRDSCDTTDDDEDDVDGRTGRSYHAYQTVNVGSEMSPSTPSAFDFDTFLVRRMETRMGSRSDRLGSGRENKKPARGVPARGRQMPVSALRSSMRGQ